jgi:hypothetical protein
VAGAIPMQRRRFTLIDAMILVAATAIGLSLSRVYFLQRPTHFRVAAISPLLATWTAALLILRARPPRPNRRKLVRQPGMAACCSIAVAILFAMMDSLIRAGKSYWKFGTIDFSNYVLVVEATANVAPSVAAVWLVLALSGLRRPDPDWIGKAGRVIGVCWIILYLVLEYEM